MESLLCVHCDTVLAEVEGDLSSHDMIQQLAADKGERYCVVICGWAAVSFFNWIRLEHTSRFWGLGWCAVTSATCSSHVRYHWVRTGSGTDKSLMSSVAKTDQKLSFSLFALAIICGQSFFLRGATPTGAHFLLYINRKVFVESSLIILLVYR